MTRDRNSFDVPQPPLEDPATCAARFERIRHAHQSEIAEDYVEMIAALIEHCGKARVGDLAARFGVSAPTVTAIIQRLRRQGLVFTEPYRTISLTKAGLDLAKACSERHMIIRDFLIAIGIDENTAATDAEGIEHHVSQKTLDVFKEIAVAKNQHLRNQKS